MASEFDPLVYTRGPVLDVPSAYSLAVAILSAVPEGDARGEGIRAAAQALRDKTVALREAWTANVKHVSIDRRPVDNVADASWRAVSLALEATSLLQGTDEDDALARRSTALLGRLFPNGLSFTQGSFTAQWAHADRLLNDIDEDGLAEELEALVGARYLGFVRRAHTAYGEALKITEPSEAAPGGLREPKRDVERALQDYVFALFGQHRPSDAANHSLLRRALAPIDAMREEQARRAASGGDAPTGGDDTDTPPPAPEPEPDGPPDEPIPVIE